MKFNGTFRGDDPARFNACVGDNGSPSYREYADGFADAAIILIDKAIDTLDVDDQIYPICFNMRHSVELRLKHQIAQLKLIRPKASLEFFDSAGSHDIGEIWSYFKRNSQLVDNRFDTLIREVDGYINDIAEVDPTGQTFRYPLSNESVKHLVDVAVINVVRLKNRFTILREKLESLHHLTSTLIDEYQQGTYTKNLSREDIRSIAERLPVFEEWKLDSFKIIKAEIKAEYKIGSAELCASINLIRSHREFAPMIGVQLSLIECDFDDLSVFFQCLEIINPLKDYLKESRIVPFDEKLFDDIMDNLESDLENDSLVHVACKEEIKLDALIEIFALYEFGRYLDYSESYEATYKSELSAKPLYEAHGSKLDRAISDYVNKTNAYRHIIESLKFLNQFEIVAKLDKLFNLGDYLGFMKDKGVV